MAAARHGRRAGAGSVCAALASLALGCAAGGGAPHAAYEATGSSALASVELECEHVLQTLDELIAVRSRDASFSSVALVEARELRRSAGDLFLSGEYELALALAREAIELLGTT